MELLQKSKQFSFEVTPSQQAAVEKATQEQSSSRIWFRFRFTDNFLNIMSNIIPNETKRFVPRNPPWITKPLKTMLNRKNRLFNNYKRYGYKAEDKVRIDAFRIECQQVVETAKLSYLTNLGNKVK